MNAILLDGCDGLRLPTYETTIILIDEMMCEKN